MITNLTVNGVSTPTVVLPHTIGAFASVEFSFTDSVATSSSPFTGQTTTFQWPGADSWSGTLTLPTLTQAQTDDWVSFLMECRGMAIPFLIGDPLKRMPRGNPQGGVPQVDGSITMFAGGQTLYTKNWGANKFRVLLPGDYLQVGYRLHRVLDTVNTDGSGKAAINIWPSLREVPINSDPVILNHPQGLFRRANNKGTWSSDVSGLSKLSFLVTEYR